MTLTAVHPYQPATVGHGFRAALTARKFSVIAEIKRRSPSKGALNPNLDAAALAQAYEQGGAACLSVLTDTESFNGSRLDLEQARSAVNIPVLRKDFLKTHQDIYDSADMGADALLLIMADIGPQRCRSLRELALTLGMDVITEVRTEVELHDAVECGAYMIMVNQRHDPTTRQITVDPRKAERISLIFDQLDPGITKIAASGIEVPGGTPIAAIRGAGYDAALMGEAFVTASDPTATLQRIIRSGGPDHPED